MVKSQNSNDRDYHTPFSISFQSLIRNQQYTYILSKRELKAV